MEQKVMSTSQGIYFVREDQRTHLFDFSVDQTSEYDAADIARKDRLGGLCT